MTPKERAVRGATVWNANDPSSFPGRPLFESLIERAVEDHSESLVDRLIEIFATSETGASELRRRLANPSTLDLAAFAEAGKHFDIDPKSGLPIFKGVS